MIHDPAFPGPADAQAELGPALPPRMAVYAMAAEVSALSRIAMELSLAGPGCDLPRAVKLLARIRTALEAGA
jgi:hypothetical protein